MAVLDEVTGATTATLEAHIAAAREVCEIDCQPHELTGICARLVEELGCVFATLVVEDTAEAAGPVWSLRYFFIGIRVPP
jgi:hypothetical protein